MQFVWLMENIVSLVGWSVVEETLVLCFFVLIFFFFFFFKKKLV